MDMMEKYFKCLFSYACIHLTMLFSNYYNCIDWSTQYRLNCLQLNALQGNVYVAEIYTGKLTM